MIVAAKLGMSIWVVKELVAAVAIVVAADELTNSIVTTIGVVLAAAISAAGGIAAARTARANRDRAHLTQRELRELRAMLDRRRRDRRGGEPSTPPGEAPLTNHEIGG